MSEKFIETSNIKIGDEVRVTFAWSDEETPTAQNFHFGKVMNINRRSLATAEILLFEVEGLDRQVYLDRIALIKEAGVEETSFVHLKESECRNRLFTAKSKGFNGRIISWNFDRTEYEVESEGNTYKVILRYSDIDDSIFATCNCLHLRNQKKICKHGSLVAVKEVFGEHQSSFAEVA